MAASARHTKLYTDQQTQAILKANLVDGIRPSDIRKLAETGQLAGLPAFELTTHVYTVIKRGRERFESTNPEALANSTRRELQRLHTLNLKKARKTPDTADVAEIARVAEALAKTQRALGPEPKAKTLKRDDTPTTETEPATAQLDGTLTNLLHLAKTPQRAKDSTSTRKHDDPKPDHAEGARTGSLARPLNGPASPSSPAA